MGWIYKNSGQPTICKGGEGASGNGVCRTMNKKGRYFLGKKEWQWHHQLLHRVTPTLVTPLQTHNDTVMHNYLRILSFCYFIEGGGVGHANIVQYDSCCYSNIRMNVSFPSQSKIPVIRRDHWRLCISPRCTPSLPLTGSVYVHGGRDHLAQVVAAGWTTNYLRHHLPSCSSSSSSMNKLRRSTCVRRAGPVIRL